jgi:hypothetical protein
MNQIVIIDQIPYSNEIHNWFAKDNLDLFSSDFNDWNNTIKVFEHILPKNKFGKPMSNLSQLSCFQFYDFINKVMMIGDGVAHKLAIDTKFNIGDIEDEVHKIKKTLIYWCLVENLPEESFEGLDDRWVEKEKGRVNRRFHYRCFYIMRNIEDRVMELRTCLNTLGISDLKNERLLAHRFHDKEFQENLKPLISMIRRAYRGDLESFIVETINRVQFFTMNDNHEKLAQMIRFEELEIPNFTEKIPHFETWRFIHPTYFDKFEDVFDEFFDEFTTECIDYYFNDYLNTSFDITKIPFYYYFHKVGIVSLHKSIVTILNIDEIRKRENDLYNSGLKGIAFKKN